VYLPPDPPLTLGALAGLFRSGGSADLGREDRFFETGRAALLAGLRSLGIGPGDEVLLPAYLCESVVTPVESVGAEARFYAVSRGLAVDPAAIDVLIGPKTRAVILIHYFGFAGPVQAVRALCDRRGIALIEDCAHALYSKLGEQPLGTVGDLAFFSPWKSLPMPDGGVLVLNRPDLMAAAPTDRPTARQTLARLAYRAVGTVEQAIGWSPRLRLLQRGSLRRAMHTRVSAGPVKLVGGSGIGWRLLRGARPAFVVGRRRRHYAQLLDACQSLRWARPLFETLPDGVCPLGLPLVAEDRDRWRDRLLAQGVNVRTYWEQLPSGVDLARFPNAAWLSDRILVLPVHQGLPVGAVTWLARTLQRLDRI
jgi:dTDP-4-amino-4,6-dideoxygalactose transaminase